MHPDQEVNTTQFDARHQPPRCRHTLLSGQTCGQPALSGRDLCRFHQAVAPSRREFILPIVEDAASLQLALNRVMRALADDVLTYKKASLLLYALQIAASNFKRLREEMQEVTNSAGMANEKSLMKELLEVLQLPETEAERLAEETAAERERENSPSGTFTIKACACDDRSQPPATSAFGTVPKSNRQFASNRACRRAPAPQRHTAGVHFFTVYPFSGTLLSRISTFSAPVLGATKFSRGGHHGSRCQARDRCCGTDDPRDRPGVGQAPQRAQH